jgi:hypothetical protein
MLPIYTGAQVEGIVPVVPSANDIIVRHRDVIVSVEIKRSLCHPGRDTIEFSQPMAVEVKGLACGKSVGWSDSSPQRNKTRFRLGSFFTVFVIEDL